MSVTVTGRYFLGAGETAAAFVGSKAKSEPPLEALDGVFRTGAFVFADACGARPSSMSGLLLEGAASCLPVTGGAG